MSWESLSLELNLVASLYLFGGYLVLWELEILIRHATAYRHADNLL